MVTVPHRIELLPPLVVILLFLLRIHTTKNTILTAESQFSTQISLSKVFEHRKIRFKEFCDSKQDIVEAGLPLGRASPVRARAGLGPGRPGGYRAGPAIPKYSKNLKKI